MPKGNGMILSLTPLLASVSGATANSLFLVPATATYLELEVVVRNLYYSASPVGMNEQEWCIIM